MARRSAKGPDPRLVDARHRVSLPRDVMRALGVQAGDYVAFDMDEGGFVRVHKLSFAIAAKTRA